MIVVICIVKNFTHLFLVRRHLKRSLNWYCRTASTCINPNLYAVSKINTLEIQKNQSNRTKVARKPLCLQSDKNVDDRPIA
jgi:hypothetical protein